MYSLMLQLLNLYFFIFFSGRSFIALKPFEHDGVDLEEGKKRKPGDKLTQRKIPNQALLSGLALLRFIMQHDTSEQVCSFQLQFQCWDIFNVIPEFCFSNHCGDFKFNGSNNNGTTDFELYQNFVSVIIVVILSLMGLITTEPLTLRLIKVWFPVIFVGMLITSMFSLKYVNVAMVTVLKNVTNVITAVGEMYLFNKHHGTLVRIQSAVGS